MDQVVKLVRSNQHFFNINRTKPLSKQSLQKRIVLENHCYQKASPVFLDGEKPEVEQFPNIKGPQEVLVNQLVKFFEILAYVREVFLLSQNLIKAYWADQPPGDQYLSQEASTLFLKLKCFFKFLLAY